MKILMDLLKLLALLAVLAGVIYGAWALLNSGQDRTKKYSHPISRPGGAW